jgi:hypothetical protein
LDSDISGDSIVPPPLFLPPQTLLLLLLDVRVPADEEVHDEYAEEAGICVLQKAEEPVAAELQPASELVWESLVATEGARQ